MIRTLLILAMQITLFGPSTKVGKITYPSVSATPPIPYQGAFAMANTNTNSITVTTGDIVAGVCNNLAAASTTLSSSGFTIGSQQYSASTNNGATVTVEYAIVIAGGTGTFSCNGAPGAQTYQTLILYHASGTNTLDAFGTGGAMPNNAPGTCTITTSQRTVIAVVGGFGGGGDGFWNNGTIAGVAATMEGSDEGTPQFQPIPASFQAKGYSAVEDAVSTSAQTAATGTISGLSGTSPPAGSVACLAIDY